jgi:ribosome-associated protein
LDCLALGIDNNDIDEMMAFDTFSDESRSMEDALPKSRTQKKIEDRALQQLGEELLAVSAEQLAAIEMPEELTEAVLLGRKTTSHGARRRQLQYIGALMRKIDSAPIRKALDNIRQGDYQKVLGHKKLERWRDGLKEGDLSVVEDILAQCPEAERQRLMQLVRNARKETDMGKTVKASRVLFRYLRQVAGM